MAPPAATFDVETQQQPQKDTSNYAVPEPLTVEGVAKRRAAAGKLVAGIAAPADVEMFKGKTNHLHKPFAKRWDSRLTSESVARTGSSLKNASKYLKNPGMISLGGGLPSSEYFPFEEISVKVPKRNDYKNTEARESFTAGKHDMAEGKSEYDLSVACNYGQGHGAAQVIRWVVEHTEIVHNPPYRDWSCTMTVGSTCAWDFCLRMLTKSGDWILSEEYTFPAAVETAAPMGVKCAAVKMDEQGMLADSLDEVCTNWDEKARGGPKPFLIYTVPTGGNPTGSTQSAERRREIYRVAQKHDLYIFEDEPYYFLQMQPYNGPDAPEVPPPKTHDEFLKSLVPSYLSMDVDGRVMRADSFSKVLAPGSRLSWITASEQIVDRFRTHSDVATQNPSGLSQIIVYKLLNDTWGHDGYLDWLLHIRMEYTRRRNVMLEACERYLQKDIISWQPPMAGMFHWIEVDWKKHPDYPNKSLDEIEEEVYHAIINRKTLLSKGAWFSSERDAPRDKMFLRVTYAAAPFDQIDEAIKRFGLAIQDAFQLPPSEVLEETSDGDKSPNDLTKPKPSN